MVGLNLTLALVANKLKLCNDSQLVIIQIQREYEAKDKRMAHYLMLVQTDLAKLSEWAIKRVPRTENLKFDSLAGVTATLPIEEAMLLPIYLQTASSLTTTSICSTAKSDDGWTHDIVKYLQTGELHEEEKHVHKVQVQAARFTLIGDYLYR